MQKKVRRLSLTLPILLAFTSATARADTTLASTFGSGETFNLNSGYAIGTASSNNQAIALSFVPSQTATLSGAILAIGSGSTSTVLNLYVESSVAGAPGTILDTLSQTGMIPSSVNSIVDFSCAACSTLSSGTEYFLVAELPSTSISASWAFTSPTQSGTVYYDLNGSATGPWSVTTDSLAAFAVEGATGVPPATPEPSSLLLLAPGLAGVFTLYKRRGLNQS